MDVIRAALGERRISYLGGSYAAMLGVAYSTLFPHRVDRLVLDSPPDYDTVWRRYELDRTAAMQDNYDAYLAWLADNDSAYGFGATPAQAGAALRAMFDQANAEPIVVGDHAWTIGELGYLVVLATLFEQLWPVVALDVAAIRAGTPPPIPLDIRPVVPPGVPGAPADNHTAVNQAFHCGDNAWPATSPPIGATSPSSPDSSRRTGRPTPTSGRAPSGRSARATSLRCPPTGPVGALVLAALHDASVPLPNSVTTRNAIRGSRLITVDRRVHVPLLSGKATACMTTAVTDYRLIGRLPAADLVC